LVGVRVNHLSDGQVNVSLVGGQSLILGDRVNNLALVDSPVRLGQKDLAVVNNGQFSVVNEEITGGKLAGYIDYRDSMLTPAFNNIGRMAIALAGTMNTLHEQGMDLNGEFGKRMFFDINDDDATSLRVLHGPDNKPPYNRELTLQITDITQLTGSNYRVEIEEGSQRFSIIRESDGVEVVSNLLTGRTPQNVEFDGLKMTFEGGLFQQGDRFYLQPTRDAAREISFEIQDPEALAFSKPLIAESVLEISATELSPWES
jgi:flagellar hook-associated protein 1 FlgK